MKDELEQLRAACAAEAEWDPYVERAEEALKLVIEAHEKYVRGKPGGCRIIFPPGTNLTHAIFDGVKMHGCGLRGADMTGSGVDNRTKPPNGFMRKPPIDYKKLSESFKAGGDHVSRVNDEQDQTKPKRRR